jgi:hypothetical protein
MQAETWLDYEVVYDKPPLPRARDVGRWAIRL